MSTLRTDAIVDLAGNGKPDLTNGVQIGGVAVTSTAAEINILDGVTSTAAELNILDGVTSTAAELNILDGVTSTAAELNILDGVTSTAAELNLIDGGTARGTTAVADGDGFLTNDGGTMRMTKVETLATYMGTKITGGSMVFIASSGAISSGTASVTFDDDDFDATKFDHYIFMLQYVRPGTDQVTFLCQVSTDGGSNFSTSSGDYHGENEENQIGFFLGENVGNDANAGVAGRFEIYAPHLTSRTYATFHGVILDEQLRTQSGSETTARGGVHLTAADVDTVRFIFSSGSITSGEIVMYGIANA